LTPINVIARLHCVFLVFFLYFEGFFCILILHDRSTIISSIFSAGPTPLEDVLKFKEDFERKYGGVHPTLYQGSYSQAIEEAKTEMKSLLVYLHSSEHEDAEQFCRYASSAQHPRGQSDRNRKQSLDEQTKSRGFGSQHSQAIRELTCDQALFYK
jgi:FAS-associated factor 2